MGGGKKKRTARGDMISGKYEETSKDAGKIANGWKELGYGVGVASGNQTGWYLLCRTESEHIKDTRFSSTADPMSYDFNNHLHLYPTGQISAKMNGKHVKSTTVSAIFVWSKDNNKIAEDINYPMEPSVMAQIIYIWSREVYNEKSGGVLTCPRD